ncbi:NUDIX hydrolase [Roseomonas sp. M0104]|uniref:NUDIX hydrolase n=1 Tax=Teichococcus coralli TaxID=2545983 RepID=A0A845BIH6_9PROT|nr:NUDIX hydrolase [Pseudoroseomonas coralli]MXP65880.1 NUDIX hydrolase [Pseudoroseomonas coralli]
MPADDQVLTEEELHALETILTKLRGQGGDLPAPLFRFITETTPTPNVDLLVRDEAKGTLLAWRDDAFGSGWHVPGSIIRHREEVAHRIAACARDEFGCAVEVADRPVALTEIFDDRGHTLGLCYRTTLRGIPGKRVVGQDERPEVGDLRWFLTLPAELYPSHFVYRDLLDALDNGWRGQGVRLFTHKAGSRDSAQPSPGGSIRSDVPLTGPTRSSRTSTR